MLLHAAAHRLQYGGSASEAVSLYALHDYLDDTMDRVRGHTSVENAESRLSKQDSASAPGGNRTRGLRFESCHIDPRFGLPKPFPPSRHVPK